MIPDHLKPSMVFIPAKPPERAATQEEGVPLHQIDRRLWPGMKTVRYGRPAKPQAGWAAETAGLTDPVTPVPDPDLHPTPNLNPAPAPDPASSSSMSDDAARTDRDVYPTERNLGGRPRAITPQRRMQLLHILRRGQSRRHAAMRMGIDAATITRAIRRDPRLALEVMEAEEEGQMFLEIWDRLYSLQETVLELQPVVSTPQLEREKEYLIACGLEPGYVRRLRQRTSEDPPPQPLPPEFQANRELKIRPWKKGWRRKKAKVESHWW